MDTYKRQIRDEHIRCKTIYFYFVFIFTNFTVSVKIFSRKLIFEGHVIDAFHTSSQK